MIIRDVERVWGEAHCGFNEATGGGACWCNPGSNLVQISGLTAAWCKDNECDATGGNCPECGDGADWLASEIWGVQGLKNFNF